MRRNWTRPETLVAFNLYCRTPFGRLSAANAEIIEVAAALGRTPGSVAMKCCNLASFDETHRARSVSGLRNGAKLDREIWEAFARDPEEIAFEAENAYATTLHTAPRMSLTVEGEDVEGLDKSVVTKVRVNQQFFRALILTGYRAQCAAMRSRLPSWAADCCTESDLRTAVMTPHEPLWVRHACRVQVITRSALHAYFGGWPTERDEISRAQAGLSGPTVTEIAVAV